jgi:predicted aspartyl protease
MFLLFKKLRIALCLAGMISALLPSLGHADSASTVDTLFALGQFDQAKQIYTTAILSTPGDIAPRLGLIRTLLRLNHWPEARTAAQEAVSKFPNSADAHGLLALTLIRAGWQPPYADEAKQALALDSGNYWGLVASGRAADWDDNTSEARRLFRQAAAAHPELPDAWADLLVLRNEVCDAKEEAATAQTYLKLNPHGHPYEAITENVREYYAQSVALQKAFGTGPLFQYVTPILPEGVSANGSNSSQTMTVNFEGDYAVFPVKINGQPFKLLFDTGGGNDILLYRNPAKRLQLPVLATGFIRGVGGREKSETLKADHLTLAGIDYKSVKILTADSFGNNMDGIFSGNILDDSVVTLDFEARTVTFAQGTKAPDTLASDKSVALPYHFYHGKLYLRLSLNTIPVWALLDTGAYQTSLSLRLAQEQLKSVPKEDVHSGTYDGKRGVGNTDKKMQYLASRDESHIGLSENPPAYIPMETIGTSDLDNEISPDPDCDFEVSLWIGMSSLTYAHRLTFDYPRHLLTFEYRDPDAVKPTKK